MKRTLSLARESLAEITADDLSAVGGAAQLASGLSCPVIGCVENPPTLPPRCVYATLDSGC